YNTTDQNKLQADAKKASNGPLTIGASAEKGGSADERVQMNSSRMVVVTNATFIQNNALTQDQQALDFISGCANWLLSREQLIGIAPKISKTLTFSLNEDALRTLRWMVLVLIPLIFVVLGGAVWWKRRACQICRKRHEVENDAGSIRHRGGRVNLSLFYLSARAWGTRSFSSIV